MSRDDSQDDRQILSPAPGDTNNGAASPSSATGSPSQEAVPSEGVKLSLTGIGLAVKTFPSGVREQKRPVVIPTPPGAPAEEGPEERSQTVCEVGEENPIRDHAQIRFDCMNRGYRLLPRTIGEGAYAKVKLGEVLPVKDKDRGLTGLKEVENRKVAVKIIDKKKVPKEFLRRFLPRELDIHYNLPNHPNVARLVEFFSSKSSIFVVLELCEKGDLLELINRTIAERQRGLSVRSSQAIFRQVCQGLQHIHSHSIVHRDLKCENILINAKGQVKITDFGFSCRSPGRGVLLKTSCGSYAYTAPEVIQGQGYDGYSADIWSLGIILYAMINGRLPFSDNDVITMRDNKPTQDLKFEKNISSDCISLVRGLLQYYAPNRPELDDVMMDMWLLDRQPTQRPSSQSVKTSHRHSSQAGEALAPAGLSGQCGQELVASSGQAMKAAAKWRSRDQRAEGKTRNTCSYHKDVPVVAVTPEPRGAPVYRRESADPPAQEYPTRPYSSVAPEDRRARDQWGNRSSRVEEGEAMGTIHEYPEKDYNHHSDGTRFTEEHSPSPPLHSPPPGQSFHTHPSTSVTDAHFGLSSAYHSGPTSATVQTTRKCVMPTHVRALRPETAGPQRVTHRSRVKERGRNFRGAQALVEGPPDALWNPEGQTDLYSAFERTSVADARKGRAWSAVEQPGYHPKGINSFPTNQSRQRRVHFGRDASVDRIHQSPPAPQTKSPFREPKTRAKSARCRSNAKDANRWDVYHYCCCPAPPSTSQRKLPPMTDMSKSQVESNDVLPAIYVLHQ